DGNLEASPPRQRGSDPPDHKPSESPWVGALGGRGPTRWGPDATAVPACIRCTWAWPRSLRPGCARWRIECFRGTLRPGRLNLDARTIPMLHSFRSLGVALLLGATSLVAMPQVAAAQGVGVS